MTDEVITTLLIKLSFSYKHRRNFVTPDAGKNDTCLMQTRKSHPALMSRQLLLPRRFPTLVHPLTDFSLIIFILRAVLVSCDLTITDLTEGFPCFFLSCKANARVKLAKTGHGPHSSKLVVICVVLLLFVLFYVLFVCKCVLYHCHRVLTQLQLTNISYHIIISYHIL